MTENTVFDLKRYFSVPGKPPITNKEMSEWWKSLSDEDKEYYRTVKLV